VTTTDTYTTKSPHKTPSDQENDLPEEFEEPYPNEMLAMGWNGGSNI
jgi:hypothetical protein